MSRIRYFLVLAPALLLLGCGPYHVTQVGVGVGYGPGPPICPYGYYGYAPYTCAPYGYYGPEWFNGGAFIGAGPWFHGPDRFLGRVDNHFDEHHYHGAFPRRGDQPDHDHPAGRFQNFHGNERRDGRGHVVHGH
jgi:hypothetical protein